MSLQVENLEKRYGSKTVLDHVNLEVREGEIFGLLGPNGSGKTTAINCILSLLKYETGNIRIFNQLMHPDAYHIKREIGYVSQNLAVFDELTVFDNIYYFCSLYKTNKKEALWLTEKALEFTALMDYRKFYPKKLSGGLLKRLNFACGIAHKPKLLILDEPTIAVDTQSKNKIMEETRQLKKEGTTIIYASHYMDEVEYLCDRIALIDRGKILAVGTKSELVSMIALEERIRVKVINLSEEQTKEIKTLPNVYKVSVDQDMLIVNFKKNQNNLVHLITYLNQQEIKYGQVQTELPTLGDVFREITGKELGE